jgi:hypothetical protein
MATTYTTYLLIPHLEQNVAQPEIPVNIMVDIIDASICGQLTIDVNADTDYTLDNTSLTYPQEWQYGILIITNTGTTNTGTVDIIIPDGLKMKYVLDNQTGSTFAIQLITESGTGVTVPDGSIYSLYCDGTNVRRIN